MGPFCVSERVVIMKMYVGVKQVWAEKCKAWKDAGGHKIGDDGYKVIYKDGDEAWSPADVFEEAYREINDLTFGMAIELLMKGFKMRRRGWNGKDMFVYYVPEGRYAPCTEAGKSLCGEDGKVSYLPYIAMKTVSGDVVPWLASQTDILAEDWEIADDSVSPVI